MNATQKLSEAALSEYLDECQEMLERFSLAFSLIESGHAQTDTLAAIYRDMHTIKGSSQLFGFSQVGQLAHAIETCLDPVRKGTHKPNEVLMDALYTGVDTIATVLKGIRETKSEPDISPVLGKLLPKLASIAEQFATKSEPVLNDKILPKELLRVDLIPPSKPSKPKTQETEKTPAMSTTPKESIGFEIFDDPAPAPVKPLSTVKPPEAPVKQVAPVSATPAATKPQVTVEDQQQSETIRVHVSLLDNLMNLVGELVLIRNQVLQHAKSTDENQEFLKMSQRLDVLTAELQNEVMKTRMQPVGNILSKFTRVVRDLGKELGKKIELEIVGAETELDKTIIEAVKDPLTHIVRNGIDHGIEMPNERKTAGKKETGVIRVKAHHESGQVIIEISDDGRGLDPKKLGAKAVEKGIFSSDMLTRMTEKEIQSVIFAPGFSTAGSVSNISGRGVGMDVVKTNVERIGGIVDLHSIPGFGTTIKLKIPLTLAIVPALIVKSNNQSFAIQQAKLVELLRIDESESGSEQIEYLQGKPVLRLRGKLLPLIQLKDVMTQVETQQTHKKRDDQITNIVVLNADTLQFGLIVDEIEDSADIVVKSLAQFLKDITAFSGATIMGDGRVALTLDINGIAEMTKIGANALGEANSVGSQISKTSSKKHQQEISEFLLVDVGAPGNYAIPLSIVTRLEEFDIKKFELSGEQKVVRYRDSLLPIFSLGQFLDLPFEPAAHILEKTTAAVVVVRRGERLYGIQVHQIMDVIAVTGQIDHTVKDRPGILGTLIAQDRVLVVVDMFKMIDTLKVKLEYGIENAEAQKAIDFEHTTRKSHHILIVEDSGFFRNYMRQILQDAGYQVEAACDGADGLAVLEKHTPNHFSLVLSDIEMPTIDGFEFVRRVRASGKYAKLPCVAITTRFSAEDIAKGKEYGFTSYMEKLNAEKLLAELDTVLEINKGGLKHAVNS